DHAGGLVVVGVLTRTLLRAGVRHDQRVVASRIRARARAAAGDLHLVALAPGLRHAALVAKRAPGYLTGAAIGLALDLALGSPFDGAAEALGETLGRGVGRNQAQAQCEGRGGTK